MKHKVHEGSCDGRRRNALLEGPGHAPPKYYFLKNDEIWCILVHSRAPFSLHNHVFSKLVV